MGRAEEDDHHHENGNVTTTTVRTTYVFTTNNVRTTHVISIKVKNTNGITTNIRTTCVITTRVRTTYGNTNISGSVDNLCSVTQYGNVDHNAIHTNIFVLSVFAIVNTPELTRTTQ